MHDIIGYTGYACCYYGNDAEAAIAAGLIWWTSDGQTVCVEEHGS